MKSQFLVLGTFSGPSEATEKWGNKAQKWVVKNQISAEICLLLTNFAPFSAKKGGQLTPLPPMLRKALFFM